MYSSKFIFSEAFRNLNLKIGLVDAGARGDLPDPWRYLSPDLLDIIGFEPDVGECEQLKKNYPQRKYFPFALWNQKGTVKIHLNKVASTSSVFPTNLSLSRFFDPVHFGSRETDRVVEVDSVKLDEVIDTNWNFDFFKVDTQGAEKMILEGARKNIESSKPMIIAEAWNVDAYQGAPSAGKIISFMEEIGYFVLDMEVTASWLYRNPKRSWLSSKSRATGVDLVFFPKFETLKQLSGPAILKRAAMLELFGYRDLAICLMENFYLGDSSMREKIIHHMLENAEIEASFSNKLKRKIFATVGKKLSPHAPIHD